MVCRLLIITFFFPRSQRSSGNPRLSKEKQIILSQDLSRAMNFLLRVSSLQGGMRERCFSAALALPTTEFFLEKLPPGLRGHKMRLGKNNTEQHEEPKPSLSVSPGPSGCRHLPSLAQGLLWPPGARSSGELGGDCWAEMWKYPAPSPGRPGPHPRALGSPAGSR